MVLDPLLERCVCLGGLYNGLISGGTIVNANNRDETAQEAFWRGEFGTSYSERNASNKLIRSNLALFSEILRNAPGISAVAELGCNIGQNLKALHSLNPEFSLSGFEINAHAASEATRLGIANIRHCSILDDDLGVPGLVDLTFTKGVLIHIAPESLKAAYNNLYTLSRQYILIVEYYNPTPVEVDYRGHTARLFKRDFAGEMMDLYDLDLIKYGFTYHRDPYFPADDANWFLLRKRVG